MLLGVTNLFFLKALKNMPHVVSVGSPPVKPPARSDSVRRTGPLNVENLKKFSPTGLLNAVRARRDGPLCLMTEHREAIWSSYAATTKPDTSVLNRLVDVGASLRVEESMTVVNNEILRRHFLELTTNFLAPFGPYLRATTPLEGVSPFVDPPPLPPFNGGEFLNSLSDRGLGKYLSKRMRPNWLDLYRRFLEGNNFMPWFRKRREAAEQEQHRLWRQARVVADIKTFISKMSELEVVDSFNAIQRHLLAEIQNEANTECSNIDRIWDLGKDIEEEKASLSTSLSSKESSEYARVLAPLLFFYDNMIIGHIYHPDIWGWVKGTE
ncbi:hypothetical protein QJS04_geneDACA012026 [Acorus gramineus]|uniref:Uncharacterized protein n=1 Tax=Acorus gramineus TaxID=55184 RepID=A0AAV9AGN5_ACOGR|nr:hypothetical protein QJS04_geneDACA012026 [Acorus gramineus]